MNFEYQERLSFLYNRLNYERIGMPRSSEELRLSRMRKLLRLLGDPHEGLRILHVAGTKGKGSTSVMLAAALSAHGIRTGLFCSPHLHRLEERFAIDGVMATSEELIALTDAVRPAVEQLDADSSDALSRGPTFFEITTAMGLLHFARKQAEAVVLEVGMGGRLDSTNVVHPELSVITTISFDHTKQLGNTLEQIATEKAGILKRDRPAMSGVTQPEARAAIRRIAAERRCRLREVEVDYQYQFHPASPPLDRPTPGQVQVRTWARDWGVLDVPLLGAHQAGNVALVLASLDALAERGWSIDPEVVTRGFSRVQWPARVEVLGEAPWVVVDCSHNVASAQALADTLRSCFPTTRRTLIFGTSRDKDLRGQLEALVPCFDQFIATRYLENPRSVPAEEVAEALRELGCSPVQTTEEPAEALEVARRLTDPGSLICATGSLFLAAETRALLLGQVSTQPPRVISA